MLSETRQVLNKHVTVDNSKRFVWLIAFVGLCSFLYTGQAMYQHRRELLFQQVETLVETSQAHMSVTPNMIITSVNAAMCDLLKAKAEELVGTDVTRFIPEEFREDHEMGLKRRKEGVTEGPLHDLICPILTTTGERIPVRITLAYVEGNGTGPFYAVKMRPQEAKPARDLMKERGL